MVTLIEAHMQWSPYIFIHFWAQNPWTRRHAVQILDKGGEIPHEGLALSFHLDNVSEQKEWNAGRLSFIE